MTLGQTIAALWLLRKLDAIEKNTKSAGTHCPKMRLKPVAPEELEEFSDTFIGGLCFTDRGYSV